MPIDKRPLSITQSFNAVKSFFNSQENNSKWKDLNTGAEGNFLMRMLANVMSVISSRTVAGIRESFHDTASFVSSNIGLAVGNGYSVYRGRNQRRIIRFIPNTYKVLPKMSQIGVYGNDLFIYNTEDVTLDPAKGAIEFEVVIGNLKEITWTAGTNKLKKFVRFEQGISEDYALYYVTGTEEMLLPTTNIKKEMVYDKFYIYTNPWKSVTVEYLNTSATAQYPYDADTQFKLKYIEINNFDSKDLSNDMFEDGTIENTLVIEDYIPFEEIDEIKVNSPLYREIQNLVRSKADTAGIIKNSLPTITSTGYKAVTPSYTAVTYLKNNFSLLNKYEIELLEKEMEPMLYFGRPFPDLVNPQREVLTLDIVLGLTDRYIEEAIITADINSLLATYSNTLKQKFDIYTLEEDLNTLSYVKYARVSFHYDERASYEYRKMGDMIAQFNTNSGETVPEATYYKCTAILGQSGQSEPVWNIPSARATDVDINTKLETIDRDLVWVAYKKLNSLDIAQEWKPNHLYTIGDTVITESVSKYMFKCVDILSYSGPAVPDVMFTEVGQYVEDGSLLLLCITTNSALPERKSDSQYRLGDTFNINGKSFQYVGHLGKTSGSTSLTFTDSEYDLYTIQPFDYINIQPGNLFIDAKLDTVLHEGETLKVSLKEDVEKDYYEVESDRLVMGSVLNVEVKDYEDESSEEDSEEGSEEIPAGDTNVININFDYVDPSTIPEEPVVEEDEGTPTGYAAAVAEEPEEESVVQNANWKELEAQLELQAYIHEWIISEGNDQLRVPMDVLLLLRDLGRLTNDEFALAVRYYDEYSPEDERQIYLYMDRYNVTRMEAINDLGGLKDPNIDELGPVIANAFSVKQYDKDTNELVYIDNYEYNPDGDENSPYYVLTRFDNKYEKRIVRHYYKENNAYVENSEVIYRDTEEQTRTFLATIEDVSYKQYPVGGGVKYLTCITPTVKLKKHYKSGSKVNFSFTITDDGRVRWEEVIDQSVNQAKWNVYNNFDFNLELKY